MTTRRIRATATSGVISQDQAWAVVCDFCDPWHPAINEMRAETDDAGHIVRAFTVAGEDTLYRERLTYFSNSDHRMGYTHLDGIEGAHRYGGWLAITEARSGDTVVCMSATIEATAARADAIAAGTQAVFDAGVKAIVEAAAGHAAGGETGLLPPSQITLDQMQIDSLPRLAITITPEGSDTLVLFLHGIGGNRDNWNPQLQAIAPYARAAALDLRGYGGSSLGASQSTVDDYCADIQRVCDVLGARRLVLCGLSYGAWIATSFAMRHPERLAGLVLSGGCTGMSEAGPDERDAFRISREVPSDEGRAPADFATAVVDVIAGPDASPEMRGALTTSMAAIPAQTYRDALRCFTNPLETFDFSRLTMPVLLMTGEHDRLAPLRR
ncbi:alpha/beta fold hydrolase [Sulfitobacter aestuariivivens]|uniref:alpha/beta fold hydrolase n=1 Tax=Sulfitobacter aestuariivivens TaxID=2766981 RepID=UPI0036106280